MSKKNFLRFMLIVMLLLGFWAMVQAAGIEVTTTQDNGPGSLRAAITTANSNNQDDTIYLPAGTGPGLVTVQVDSQGLSPGAYPGQITVEAPGAINSPQMVTVILRIYTTGSTSVPFGEFATLFPCYNNSAGAGGHFYLDTTQYENGVHTIQWTVTDDAGNSDGIGSRYFTIQNPGGTTSGKAQSAWRTAYSTPAREPLVSKIPIDYSEPVRIKKGYNREIETQILYPDEDGVVNIRIKELERVEIRLANVPLFTGSEWSTGIPAGFQLIGDRLAALPIGSFLDSKNGIFSWQPGPGYLGLHELVFFKRSKTGEIKQQFITFRIRPKFE